LGLYSKKPSLAFYFLKTIVSQRRAQRNRLKWIKEGIQVPPVMIFSITNKCNLNCKGCYNKALRIPSKDLQHFLQDCRLKKNYLGDAFLQEEVLFM